MKSLSIYGNFALPLNLFHQFYYMPFQNKEIE